MTGWCAFFRRWRIAAIYMTVVALVSWGVWSNDQANAGKVAEINKALILCRTPPDQAPARRSFFD